MKVLFLTHSFPRKEGDAAGSFVLRLAVALRAEDVDVHVVAPAAAGVPASEEIEGIRVDRFRYAPRRYEKLAYTGNMAGDFASSWSAKLAMVGFLGSDFVHAVRARRSFEPDVVHAHWWFPNGVVGTWLGSLSHIPVVTTLHGTDVTLVGVDPSYLPITRFSIEQSHGVTAISHHLKAATVAMFGVGTEIRVIHNSVNCDLYRPRPDIRVRQEYAPTGEKILIHLSNFRPVKRILDCVRVLAKVNAEVPSRLLMVGDGPDRGPAEALARELHLEDRVLFLGKQLRVSDLLPAADVLLLPSQMESFGLAALEAMACGVPPIASRVGGVPEVVTHGADGFLLPVGDTDAMAEAALSVLGDPAAHGRMAAAARHTAETRFHTEKIIPQYESYYREVCGTG